MVKELINAFSSYRVCAVVREHILFQVLSRETTFLRIITEVKEHIPW